MAQFIDNPLKVVLDEIPMPETSLREYISHSMASKGDVGSLIHYYLNTAVGLVLESYEYTISQETAETILFNELREGFGLEIAERVFKEAKEFSDFINDLQRSYTEGKLDLFFRDLGAPVIIEVDPDNIAKTAADIDAYLNLTDDELKRMSDPRIDDSPSDEGTSFN